jgi:hypothetical protein
MFGFPRAAKAIASGIAKFPQSMWSFLERLSFLTHSARFTPVPQIDKNQL